MDIIIQEWLKEIATKNSSASPDLVYFSNNDTCNSSMPYKNEIGEVAIHDIINIYIDSQIVSLESNIEKNDIALTGSGSFSLSNGDYFRGDFLGNLSDREGKFTRLSNGGCTIEGTWKDGRAEGLIEITGMNSFTKGIYHEGKRKGMFREFKGCKEPSYSGLQDVVSNLIQVGYYENDIPVGIAWRRLIGGSYLVGTLDKETEEFSGKNILYLYPDLIWGIEGRFLDSKLEVGQTCIVEDVETEHKSGILMPKVTKKECDIKIKRDISTKDRISSRPLFSDEWERQRVEVRSSCLAPTDGMNPGEGLFAKSNIKKGAIAALFNGVRQASEKNSFSEYRIKLNGDTDLDIIGHDKDIRKYCATLGHKVNHCFMANSRWSRLEHPRFGLICAISALRDIEKDEEILVNYGLPMADAPSWYKHLWVHHCRVNEGWSDERILKWCYHKYEMHGKTVQLPI